MKDSSKKKDQKDRLTQIIELLEAKLKSFATAPPVDGNVVDVGATTSSQETPVNIDDEKKQASDQPTGEITLQIEDDLGLNSKDDQQDSPHSLQSSVSDSNDSTSSFTKLPEGDTENGNG
ncbi:hypothetical protein GOM44_04380, partial [Wolbachia endosymbiont of Atemnus politus]|uniref:hypothetical protein n=1 Tax=Wolbachia endosymbiont of Atemnus politus TaxID=2682840 RepID=UPI001574181D